MINIKLSDGSIFKAIKIERRVEVANPTQMPIAFYIEFDYEGKKVEVPYSAILSITYE